MDVAACTTRVCQCLYHYTIPEIATLRRVLCSNGFRRNLEGEAVHRGSCRGVCINHPCKEGSRRRGSHRYDPRSRTTRTSPRRLASLRKHYTQPKTEGRGHASCAARARDVRDHRLSSKRLQREGMIPYCVPVVGTGEGLAAQRCSLVAARLAACSQSRLQLALRLARRSRQIGCEAALAGRRES